MFGLLIFVTIFTGLLYTPNSTFLRKCRQAYDLIAYTDYHKSLEIPLATDSAIR
jgi:hypothetical protein